MRVAGLEPARNYPYPLKGYVAANYTTLAHVKTLVSTTTPCIPALNSLPTVEMFEYNSVQTHSDFKNGAHRSKTNRVTIKGKKGYKEITIITNGKKKTSKKKLKASEIKCIQRCQFVPGLFKDCQKCLDKF